MRSSAQLSLFKYLCMSRHLAGSLSTVMQLDTFAESAHAGGSSSPRAAPITHPNGMRPRGRRTGNSATDWCPAPERNIRSNRPCH